VVRRQPLQEDIFQYLRMTFAQLTHRESLCDIEVCLRAQKDKLYHRGIQGNVSRSAVPTRMNAEIGVSRQISFSGINSHPSPPVCRRGLGA